MSWVDTPQVKLTAMHMTNNRLLLRLVLIATVPIQRIELPPQLRDNYLIVQGSYLLKCDP
jgi:hypothetical protein